MHRILLLIFFAGMSVSLEAQYCGLVSYSGADGLDLIDTHNYLDRHGNFWQGSNGKGVYVFDGKSWINFSEKDGLLYAWARPHFEDKEGGLWIWHNYSFGVTRFLNGKFQPYKMKRPDVKELNEGQKWMPRSGTRALGLDFGYVEYDYKRELPYTMFTDSLNRVFIYYFDYESGEFDPNAQLFLPETSLAGIPRDKISLINDFHGRPCIQVRKEKRHVWYYEDGSTINIPVNPVTEEPHLIPLGKDSFRLFKSTETELFSYENEQWVSFPKPDLERYGFDNKKPDLTFFNWRENKRPGKFEVFTLWKINEPEMSETYMLAEHEIPDMEVRQTFIFSNAGEQSRFGQIKKDDEGTFWLSDKSGTHRLFPNQMFIKNGTQNMPKSEVWGVTQMPNGKVWFSSYGGGMANFDGLFVNKPKPTLQKFKFLNDTGLNDEEGNIYFPSASVPNLRGILKFNKSQVPQLLLKGIQGFYLGQDKKGGLMYGTYQKGLWILEAGKEGIHPEKWIKIDASKGLSLLNVLMAFEDKYGRYWMGRGSEGTAVYIPEKDTVFNWDKDDDKTHLGTMSIAEDGRGNLWFGTDNGLYFFENRKNIDGNFDFKNALQKVGEEYTGNSLVQICHNFQDKYLIVGNQNGYYQIDLDYWYQPERQLFIQSFIGQTGHRGGSMVQNGVWTDDRNYVWMTCSEGAVRFSPNETFRDTLVPRALIERIEVDEKVFTDFGKPLKLNETERTLSIFVSHESENFPDGNVNYRYRLTGDTAWSELIDREQINLINLAPNDYRLELMAEKNGLRSEPVSVEFSIPQIWWQNPVYWLGILGVIVAAGLYLRQKEKRIHAQKIQIEKSKVEMANISKEKDKLQVQAIVNQLNPHFINNALQWLQVRLDNQDDEEGVSVVGKLSQNISTVFKNSRNKKSYHSLASEMKLAENYLYIQKRRFRDKLKYELPDENALSAYEDVNIPLMNIQIHVENAVEHGIRNKQSGRGQVKVFLEDKSEYLKLIIEDDGVGREAAKVIGSKGTQNGTKMLKELETIYNRQNEFKLNQYYEDGIFEDENGNKYGTRVVIELPKKYNFKI